MEVDDEIVDNIYECAFAPDLWPGVLDKVAQLAEARGCVIFTASRASMLIRWSSSACLRDDMATYVSEGWYWKDHRSTAYRLMNPGCFVTEVELFSGIELEADPTFIGFHASRGRGRTIITGTQLPTGDWFCVTAERDYAAGPANPSAIKRLNDLRPHLARSLLMAERLQMERAHIMTEALALMGIPALVFERRGRVLAVNRLMDDMRSHVVWRTKNRIAFTDRVADVQFLHAIETLCSDSIPSVRSFAIRGHGGTAALVAHVVPVRGVARDVFLHCAGLLMLTPVALQNAAPIELLQSLFDLSPAEARVARRLVSGNTVDQIAADACVSSNTVRTQVRGVLEKTGCRRQAEVVALLGGFVVPRC